MSNCLVRNLQNILEQANCGYMEVYEKYGIHVQNVDSFATPRSFFD